jgi:hypothetical protein
LVSILEEHAIDLPENVTIKRLWLGNIKTQFDSQELRFEVTVSGIMKKWFETEKKCPPIHVVIEAQEVKSENTIRDYELRQRMGEAVLSFEVPEVFRNVGLAVNVFICGHHFNVTPKMKKIVLHKTIGKHESASISENLSRTSRLEPSSIHHDSRKDDAKSELKKKLETTTKDIRPNLFNLVFYGDAVDLMNVLANPEKSQLAHKVILLNAKNLANNLQAYLPAEITDPVSRIMGHNPDEMISYELAQDISALLLQPIIQKYLSARPLRPIDQWLASHIMQVVESKDEFSSEKLTTDFSLEKVPLVFSSFPRSALDDGVGSLEDMKGSVLVFAIDISRYDEYEDNGLNCVIAQIKELQILLSTGFFDDLVLTLTEVKKFVVKLSQTKLTACFSGDDVPTTAGQEENLEFLFQRIPKMLNHKIRIANLALNSISVDKDTENFKKCLKQHLPVRFLEEYNRLKRAKMLTTIGAGAATIAAGAVTAVVAVPSILGWFAENVLEPLGGILDGDDYD